MDLPFAKNTSNKYSQKILDTAKKYTTDAIKTASKKVIQKRAEATSEHIFVQQKQLQTYFCLKL